MDLLTRISFSDADEKIVGTIRIKSRQGDTAIDTFFAGQEAQQFAGVARSAYDKFVKARPAETKRESVKVANMAGRVSSLLSALVSSLLNAALTHRFHIDCRCKRNQTFVGADI